MEANILVCAVGETGDKTAKAGLIQRVGENSTPGIVGSEAHGEDSRKGIQAWRGQGIWVRYMVEANLPTPAGRGTAVPSLATGPLIVGFDERPVPSLT